MHAAALLKYSAFVLMTLLALVGGTFAGGEALADPGGWAAVLMIGSYFVPVVVLSVFAYLEPGPTGLVLLAIGALVIVVNLIDAGVGFVPQGWGPVGTIAALAVAAGAGFLGLHRPTMAGWLLVALGLGQGVAAVLTRTGEGGIPLSGLLSGSTGVVVVPLVVIGVLFLLAGLSHPHVAPVAPAH